MRFNLASFGAEVVPDVDGGVFIVELIEVVNKPKAISIVEKDIPLFYPPVINMIDVSLNKLWLFHVGNIP